MGRPSPGNFGSRVPTQATGHGLGIRGQCAGTSRAWRAACQWPLGGPKLRRYRNPEARLAVRRRRRAPATRGSGGSRGLPGVPVAQAAARQGTLAACPGRCQQPPRPSAIMIPTSLSATVAPWSGRNDGSVTGTGLTAVRGLCNS